MVARPAPHDFPSRCDPCPDQLHPRSILTGPVLVIPDVHAHDAVSSLRGERRSTSEAWWRTSSAGSATAAAPASRRRSRGRPPKDRSTRLQPTNGFSNDTRSLFRGRYRLTDRSPWNSTMTPSWSFGDGFTTVAVQVDCSNM